MKRTFSYYIGALSLTGLIISCQTTKPIVQSDKPIPAAYRNQEHADSTSIATIPWRAFFQDPYLQVLIEEGLQNNLDLKIGLTRIESAKAVLSQAKAAFLPEVAVGGTLQRARMSYPQSFGFFKYATLHEVAATSSWEIDVWGKLASAKRSTYYQLLQTETTQYLIQTQLVAQIAQYYYQLLLLDKQVRIVERTIENRANDVKTMRFLKESNQVTGAAVVQSEANYLEAQITLPMLQKQLYQVENALSVLLGKEPHAIARGSIDSQEIPVPMKIGVVAQLLSYRPDVKMEELALASYFEDIQVAKRAFYPNITLTASAGYSSYEFKNWFTPTGLFAQLTGGLVQPIFNKRQNKTRLAQAKTKYQEQVYRFQHCVLQAGQEVTDALYAFEIAEQQIILRQQQVEKLELAVDFTKKLLLYHPATTYTDVLTSEQAYLQAELEKAHSEGEKWQAIIKLYRSLGGGWMDESQTSSSLVLK